MRLLHRRVKYVPPNPHVPEFTSEGGGELWKLVMELKYQFGGLEAKVNMILALVLLGIGAILARLLGAF